MSLISVLTCTALWCAGAAAGDDQKKPERSTPAPAPAPEGSRFERGVAHFFAGRIKEALLEWDAQVAAAPADLPGHWQRGIALYYAERYADGRKQFEEHQKVNAQDVENAAWHFLCVAKTDGVEAARKAFIPITADPRVPMKEIHALFAGSGTPEAVMKAAEKSEGRSPAAKNIQSCYAHLYLGLHDEAHGKTDEAQRHLLLAAANFPPGSYMGEVARVHCKVRGWKQEKAKETP